MNIFPHDPEIPSGFQDADLALRDLQTIGARSEELRQQGQCAHGWLYTDRFTGACRCKECGKVTATEDEMFDDRERQLG